MHGDILGVVFSVLLIAVGYVFHELLRKKNAELARKVLHIWVSNWYFIYLYCFESPWMAIAGLFVFAAINLFLEMSLYHSHRYGTIYYPISIVALLCLQYYYKSSMAAVGCGILAMGYGDGLAALVGGNTKSRTMPFINDKTINGSLTMFVVTTIVVLLVAKCSIVYALVIGFIAALFEAYIPLGLDNISVPVIVFFLVNKLC